MKDLYVYYCPACGRYSYCQPKEAPVCPVCDMSMTFLIKYTYFCSLNREQRDKLLVHKIIARDPSASGRFLAFMRSSASGEAATLMDSHIRQLESENKKLNDTIEWMHQTIWELLAKNRELESRLKGPL